jgi:hypothetical protein
MLARSTTTSDQRSHTAARRQIDEILRRTAEPYIWVIRVVCLVSTLRPVVLQNLPAAQCS